MLAAELRLSKHLRLIDNWRDARRVRAYVRREGITLVHANLANDHAIGARAVRSAADIRLVRSSYDGEALKSTLRLRRALRSTDALLCVSEDTASDAAARLGYPRDRVFRFEAPVDTQRFDPARGERLREAGAVRLGVGPEHFVVGIVARMQTHRRFEVLLEAIRCALGRVPRLRAVVIGRGTNQETVAKEPARRMGLHEIVRFPGYLDGDDYVGALAALDVKVFLVPGSDGSCRAVREALAMGKPVVAARRGMLPAIVRHGETGFIVDDEDPAALADALCRLAADEEERRRLSAQARADAADRFSVARVAEQVRAAYEHILARPRRALERRAGRRR